MVSNLKMSKKKKKKGVVWGGKPPGIDTLGNNQSNRDHPTGSSCSTAVCFMVCFMVCLILDRVDEVHVDIFKKASEL